MPRPTADDPPWPYLTMKQAARDLGVTTDLLRSLVNTPRLRGQFTLTRKGTAVWLVSREDVEALADETHRA